MSLAAFTIIGAICSYFVGGIPFGLIISRARCVDMRRAGSGNIGATNVGRVVGWPWGVGVFLLDALKGALPAALAG